MGNIIENDAEEEQIESENSKKNSENDFKYEKLKKEIRRKYRAAEKQAMRRYFEKEDPDFVVIINDKIYRNPGGNLGGKIRKRGRRNSGFSDLSTNIMRIRPNPPPLYNTNSEQEWRIFVNTLDNY